MKGLRLLMALAADAPVEDLVRRRYLLDAGDWLPPGDLLTAAGVSALVIAVALTLLAACARFGWARSDAGTAPIWATLGVIVLYGVTGLVVNLALRRDRPRQAWGRVRRGARLGGLRRGDRASVRCDRRRRARRARADEGERGDAEQRAAPGPGDRAAAAPVGRGGRRARRRAHRADARDLRRRRRHAVSRVVALAAAG